MLQALYLFVFCDVIFVCVSCDFKVCLCDLVVNSCVLLHGLVLFVCVVVFVCRCILVCDVYAFLNDVVWFVLCVVVFARMVVKCACVCDVVWWCLCAVVFVCLSACVCDWLRCSV